MAHIVFNALDNDWRAIWSFAEKIGLDISGSTKHCFSAVALAHVHGTAKAITDLRREVKRRGAYLSPARGRQMFPWGHGDVGCPLCNAYYAKKLADAKNQEAPDAKEDRDDSQGA